MNNFSIMNRNAVLAQKRRRWNESAKDKLFVAIIIVPSLALMVFTIGIPIVKSLYLSLFHVTLLKMTHYEWNDFGNYTQIFTDQEFYSSLKTTFVYVFCIVFIQFLLGMMQALILNTNIRFRRALRTLILIPWVVPTIVGALLWMWLFQPQYGVVNYILMSLHVIDKPNEWLTSPSLALPAVMMAALWRQLPFMTTMLLAGLQGIPEEIYEAAEMDGANKFQQFFYVTLPFLKPTIRTVTLIAFIDNFKMFPLFWIMTGGGPLNTTTTLAILSYKTAFIGLDLGKGAAIGGIWLIILLLFSWTYNRLFAIGEGKERSHS